MNSFFCGKILTWVKNGSNIRAEHHLSMFLEETKRNRWNICEFDKKRRYECGDFSWHHLQYLYFHESLLCWLTTICDKLKMLLKVKNLIYVKRIVMYMNEYENYLFFFVKYLSRKDVFSIEQIYVRYRAFTHNSTGRSQCQYLFFLRYVFLLWKTKRSYWWFFDFFSLKIRKNLYQIFKHLVLSK